MLLGQFAPAGHVEAAVCGVHSMQALISDHTLFVMVVRQGGRGAEEGAAILSWGPSC
jgi:hypothetical protein